MSTYSNDESGGEEGGGCSCECSNAGRGPTPVRSIVTPLLYECPSRVSVCGALRAEGHERGLITPLAT